MTQTYHVELHVERHVRLLLTINNNQVKPDEKEKKEQNR